MYPVDEEDTVVALTDVPRPCAGAPLPLALADDCRLLLLAYVLPDPNWDGPDVDVASHEAVAVIRFRSPYAHMFGPPNDEAFDGHPLARRGLEPYGVFEVRQSSWIRQLERMNSVHPRHERERFMGKMKHFIFTFHDSTFECIADGFDVQLCTASQCPEGGWPLSALKRMTKLLEEDPAYTNG
jgi:hypothetical protein